MINNYKILGIIPARSGSKRLPGKNVKLLGGKPLIQWTIEAAQKSKYIDQIHISTDCDKVLEIAKKMNIDVKAKRPQHLASDEASTFDVIVNILEMVEYKDFKYFMLLQPTSPFRTENDIDKAVEQLNEKQANAIISVCTTSHPPQWTNTLNSELSLINFIRPEHLKRSQELETFYQLNGAIYLVDVELFKKEKTFFLSQRSFAYIMKAESSIDIDTKLDFLIAEAILKLGINTVDRQ